MSKKRGRDSDIAPPPKCARFAPVPPPTTTLPFLALDEAVFAPMELDEPMAAAPVTFVPMEETAAIAAAAPAPVPTSPISSIRSLPSALSPPTNETHPIFVTVDSLEEGEAGRRMTEVMAELLGCVHIAEDRHTA